MITSRTNPLAHAATLLLAVVVLGATVVPLVGHEKGGTDETGPYDVVEDWFKPPHGRAQHVSGVFVDDVNRILVTTTSELPLPRPRSGEGSGAARDAAGPSEPPHKHFVLVVDANGAIVEEWTQWTDLMVVPHKIQVNPYDPEKHVWIIDANAHQIHEFSHDGKQLVMTLGEKNMPGTDQRHFNRPTDMAFLPDGTMFVADGYNNARVVKFDRDGRFLLEWGSKGTGPGQFNSVHCVALDARRRVYVADRNNNRVQIFDEFGKYLDEWPNIRDPNHLTVTRDQALWVTSGFGHKLAKFDLEGRLLSHWGSYGAFPGGLNDPHQISVDADGNLYVADSGNNRVQKFKPKPNAKRSLLVGQPFK
jgi:DNA-binding beta-propeller fold protein YncE